MAEETNATPSLEELRTGSAVNGTVTRLVLSGAMVNIGLDKEAFLHISQLGKPNLRNVEEVLQQGQSLESYVLKIDSDRVVLTMIKPAALQWNDVRVGEIYRGTVARIEKFGAFVDIGAERPGMVHVSEMADGYIQSPDEVVRVGDVIDVRVIKLNRKKRQIDLSMKEEAAPIEISTEAEEKLPTAMEIALRRAQAVKRDENKPSGDKRSRFASQQEDIFKRTLKSLDK